MLQAYQRAVKSNPSQLTGWQGLTKLYEKILNESQNDTTNESVDRKWNIPDVVTAYSKMLSICSQNVDVDKYINISTKLANLYQQKLNDLDGGLHVLSEKIGFLETQKEYLKVKETHAEIVQMISFEGQTKSLDNQHSTKLCEAIEQVRMTKYSHSASTP